MFRLKPIRRRPRKALKRPVLRGLEAAFWIVFALAAGIGGESAITGLGRFGGALLPGMAAEARTAPERHGIVASLQLFGFAPSIFAPAVLYPVVTHAFPAWMRHPAPPKPRPQALPAIAIVIDDLGADVSGTRQAIALPRPVTLSFLPYPSTTPGLASEAKLRGHEVLVHLPMQADDSGKNPGPMALQVDLPADENIRRMDWALERVPGFTGINNHEGSLFTQDRAALIPVMEALYDRHVFFFDSRTTPNSQVVAVARAFGVPSASRDVFLDDVETPDAITAQLDHLEAIARAEGVAIAIGHPHAATLAVLKRWCAAGSDFRLIPVSTALRLKTERELGLPVASLQPSR